MFSRKKPKPPERFYLLPGQGGKNFHRKQRVILAWSTAAAVLFGGLLALALWWMSQPKP